MTNVLAVAVVPELVNRIAEMPEHRLISISRDNLATARHDHSFIPDLILVGTSVGRNNAIEYARRVLDEYPAMVVALVAEPDRELIRAATAVGIRRVMPADVSDRELATLLKRAGASARRHDLPAEQSHHVIVVASPKGGVGKTTIAVNLAALLAEAAPGEVVLLDLDLQFGDVSTVLDLQPEHTVADALHSGAVDSMLLRTLLVLHPAKFYVLCGANHPADTGRVAGDAIRKLVHQFAQSFRYVVIDTSAGLQEETLASLEEASDVVFAATLDVATLRNLRKEVDVLAELGLLPERRHVVLNRTDRLSGLTDRDAESILGLPVSATLPTSATVPLAANHGCLAVDVKKKNTVRKPLQHVAGLVAGPASHPVRSSRPSARRNAQPSGQSRRPGRHR